MYGFDNRNKTKVMVMSEETWNMMKEKMYEDAKEQNDPFLSINRFKGVEVVIDSELPFNTVEVYEKWMYEAVIKFGRGKKSD